MINRSYNMSADDKQKMGDAIMWILRALTALGAFFLIKTYGVMSDTNMLLQEHLRQYASDRVEVQVRLGIAEKELERYRNEKERRRNYEYEHRNE